MSTVSARALIRLILTGEDGLERREVEDINEIANVVGESGKRESVTLANGFTALSPPTGAQAVIIRPVSGAFTYTLKGVTGDTGIVFSAASTLPIMPIVLPLGATPSIGITCTGAGVVECIWL